MTASISTVTQEQGTVQSFVWNYQNSSFKVIYETFGLGNPVLLLSAFSTVSSRTEMTQIAHLLALNYQVTVLDWLGFGDSEKPDLDYNPEIYQQLLTDFVINCFKQPILSIIAEQSPPYSKREMEAISQLANVTTVQVSGTLGVYEEYAEEVSQEIRNFLGIA